MAYSRSHRSPGKKEAVGVPSVSAIERSKSGVGDRIVKLYTLKKYLCQKSSSIPVTKCQNFPQDEKTEMTHEFKHVQCP